MQNGRMIRDSSIRDLQGAPPAPERISILSSSSIPSAGAPSGRQSSSSPPSSSSPVPPNRPSKQRMRPGVVGEALRSSSEPNLCPLAEDGHARSVSEGSSRFRRQSSKEDESSSSSPKRRQSAPSQKVGLVMGDFDDASNKEQPTLKSILKTNSRTRLLPPRSDQQISKTIQFKQESTEDYDDEDVLPSISELQEDDDSQLGLFPTVFGLDCFGAKFAKCGCKRPDYNRLSLLIVRHSPCFWFCGTPMDMGATDRRILYRLNILCSFFALGQIISAILLAYFLYSSRNAQRGGGGDHDGLVNQRDDRSFDPDLWNLNISIFLTGILGAGLFITMIGTLKVIRQVDLRGAVRYMWIMVWILPLQIFLVISLLDYHRVTQVWITHWWSLPSMSYFRGVFCAPGTADGQCIVPVKGGVLFANETDWCVNAFNETNCEKIRDEAQGDMLAFSYLVYNLNAVWGLLLVVLLILSINVLEGIITKPIVQQSREANVPLLLTFPICGCFAIGGIYLFSPSSPLSYAHAESDNGWIGIVYIVCGVFFFVAALLGWFISSFSILNSNDKRNKVIALNCFIAIVSITLLLVAGIFLGSILLSTSLVDVPLTDDERGEAACVIDSAQSCSFCDNLLGLQQCPEWTESEVVKVLQTQLKQSATLSAIYLLYSVSALRFGFVLKSHLSRYQIDYV